MRLLIAIALAALSGAALAAPDPAMKALMAAEVNPGALAFWAGGNDPPEGEASAAAEAGARTLQAAGRAMAEPGVSRPGRWNEFAALMVSTGAEGEAASRARNAEQAFEIGGRLYDACNGCHKTYVPTPQRLP
jgi:hypothetical protein